MRRTAGLALGGVLGTLALVLVLSPNLQSPLRWTVAMSPLLVAAFAALRTERAFGESKRRPLRRGLLAAVAAWGLLAIGYQRLALPDAEPLLAASGGLLIAAWLALELPGLLRQLARSRGALPPRAFFLTPFLVYAAVLPWVQVEHVPSGDEPYYLLVTHSIAYDGDIDLANNYADDDALAFMPRSIEPQADDPTGDRGQIYSRHSPAVPALLAAPYRLAGRTGAALLMLLLSAGVAWSGLALARELHPGRHRGQLLAWLTLAFASPLAVYSYRFWGEVPAMLCLTLASVVILRHRAGQPIGLMRLSLLALLLAAPILVKSRFVLVTFPLGVLAWWRAGRRATPVILVGAAVLVTGAATLVLNLAHFDQILGAYTFRALDLRRYGATDWLNGAAGFFLDGAFGLGAAYPLWLLLVPALAIALTRRTSGRALLLAWVPYFLVLLPRNNSFSQFAPPFRYALVVLPLLAACLVPVLEDRRAFVRTVTRALAALTLILTVVWTVQPEWTVHRVTGSTHLLDRLMLVTHNDFGRLFPSYLRVRAAAWIWAGGVLLLAASWRWWPARPRLRGLATPLLLLAAAAIAWTANNAPTRTVEFEDLWLEHRGGEPYPEPWEPWAQPRAWQLAPGDQIRVPVVVGGPLLRSVVRLGRFDETRGPAALELVADDGRVLQYWTDTLDPDEPWSWRTLPPVALPADRPVGLTFRAVEPPPDDSRLITILASRVSAASPDIQVAMRFRGLLLADWEGLPEPNLWIDMPVRRLRWREGETHPLVLVPRGQTRTGSRGAKVVLRFRFEPPGSVRAQLRSGRDTLGEWSARLRRTGQQRLEAEVPSQPKVWLLPEPDYGTLALDRARFEWMAHAPQEGEEAGSGAQH